MRYVDGFVLPVPHANREAYLALASRSAPIFREYGALQVVETWGHDVPHGTTTDFFKAVQAAEGENVVFSWVVWPSKEVRDEAWGKVMQDERMKGDGDVPFDGKRMFFGGFETLLDTGA